MICAYIPPVKPPGIFSGSPAGIPPENLAAISAGRYPVISTKTPLRMYSEIFVDIFTIIPPRITTWIQQ